MVLTPQIEPMLPSEAGISRSNLPDLVIDLERKAASLAGQISPASREVLEEHMRVINSYYSNLIEGNATHPREIRQAMRGDYSADPIKRDLQKESLAHIETQRWMLQHPPTKQQLLGCAYIQSIHKSFYAGLPASLKCIQNQDGSRELPVTPGAFRQSSEQDVEVGRHTPPSHDEIAALMARFQEAYDIDKLTPHLRPIAAMASHHRLLWIHPFLDGNGRVARLHTDTFLRTIGVGASGIWCLSRGLARKSHDYKAALAKADFPRQGNRDGRGALSESSLIAFCEFMLSTAIDQVEYMENLLKLGQMLKRIKTYVEDRNKGLVSGIGKLRPEAIPLLERVFLEGELERRDIEGITGLSRSVSRKLVQQLKEEGLLTETTTRSPLRWAIPDHAERYYFPELSP